MKASSDITILIPTHFRHKYLKRSLEYFRNFDIRVIVADSSDRPYPEADKLQSGNITYLHFPGHTYPSKMNIALAGVKTPYAVFCADDDFVIPDSLKVCVDFLNNNKDYSSCQGYFSGFENINGKFIFYPMYTFVKEERDLGSDSPEERLHDFMGDYLQLVYSVDRIENLRWLFSHSSDKIKNLNLVEFSRGYIPLIDGKHRVLPVLFALREKIPGSDGAVTDTLQTIVSSEKFKAEYGHFLNMIADFYSAKTGSPREEGLHIAETSVEKYLRAHPEKPARGVPAEKPAPGMMAYLRLAARSLASSFFSMRYGLDADFGALSTLHKKGYPLHDKTSRKALRLILSILKKHNINPAEHAAKK